MMAILDDAVAWKIGLTVPTLPRVSPSGKTSLIRLTLPGLDKMLRRTSCGRAKMPGERKVIQKCQFFYKTSEAYIFSFSFLEHFKLQYSDHIITLEKYIVSNSLSGDNFISSY